MPRIFKNADLDLTITFHADERFVIIGDADLVSDDTLFDLFEGKTVEGWAPVVID